MTKQTTFTPSKQQQQLFDWVKNGTGSCILESVAGSGKTTTLLHAMEYMKGKIFYGAFNKRVCDELKEKVDVGVNVNISTMHSAGLSALKKQSRFAKVEMYKVNNIFRKLFERSDPVYKYQQQVVQLVSLAKSYGFGIFKEIEDEKNWLDLIIKHEVRCSNNPFNEDTKNIIKAAIECFDESNECSDDFIDFDDMIYLPLLKNIKPFQYDWVLIDEAQDSNAIRRELALRMLKPGGRMICVGDSNQAIYGFSGADSDSMQLFQDELQGTELSLTVSYRCPVDVVTYSQQWVPHINSHPTAIKGSVLDIPTHNMLQRLRISDVVLCHRNAPLLKTAYSLLINGTPARVEGREIGTTITNMANRFKAVKSFVDFINKITTATNKDIQDLRNEGKVTTADQLEDTLSCLLSIVDKIRNDGADSNHIGEAISKEVDKLFGDDVGDDVVKLTTIYKAKGREWPCVFWIKHKIDQHNYEDVRKLSYVAATRAKSELYVVID